MFFVWSLSTSMIITIIRIGHYKKLHQLLRETRDVKMRAPFTQDQREY